MVPVPWKHDERTAAQLCLSCLPDGETIMTSVQFAQKAVVTLGNKILLVRSQRRIRTGQVNGTFLAAG